jgi:methylglyoxal synthase
MCLGYGRPVATVTDMRERRTGRMVTTIALVAHDAKKEDLRLFMHGHKRMLGGFRFFAPEDTARVIADLDLDVDAAAPDLLGGDLQIGAAIVEGRIDAVIFLHDPLAAMPAEPDVRGLLKVCDIERVPVATNLATAEILIHHLVDLGRFAERHDTTEDEREMALERVLWLASSRSNPSHEGPSR